MSALQKVPATLEDPPNGFEERPLSWT